MPKREVFFMRDQERNRVAMLIRHGRKMRERVGAMVLRPVIFITLLAGAYLLLTALGASG